MQLDNQVNSERKSNYINSEYVEMANKEILLMIMFFVGLLYMLHATFNAEVNQIQVGGVVISLHYIFPFLVALICFFYLFFKYLFYRNVVKLMSFDLNFIVIKRMNLKKQKINQFLIYLDESNFNNKTKSFMVGFTRKKIKFIGISSDRVMYYIPYSENSKDELLKLLLESGGKIMDNDI